MVIFKHTASKWQKPAHTPGSYRQNKWFKGDNATTQIALYKLIGTEEESQRLNGSRQEIDHTTKGQPMVLRLSGSKENEATQ